MSYFVRFKNVMQDYQANIIVFANMLRKKNKQFVYFVFLCMFVYSFHCYMFASPGPTLWSIDKCPVCYGFSGCDKLFAKQLLVNGGGWRGIVAKQTVFYGTNLYGVKVVFKRLASDSQFQKLDDNLCKAFQLGYNCKPTDAVESLLVAKVLERVSPKKLQSASPVKGLVMCPKAKQIHDMIEPLVHHTSPRYEHDMMNIWTMLTVNPEPIILQLLLKADGWPVPTYGGVCGRLEIVTNDGRPISTVSDYRVKLKLARAIMEAALLFTYKHDRSPPVVSVCILRHPPGSPAPRNPASPAPHVASAALLAHAHTRRRHVVVQHSFTLARYSTTTPGYRFYLMDWSLDNIVYNDYEEISFVDLEDIVVLDKSTEDTSGFPKWLSEYGASNKPGTKLHDNVCTHHLSDHNIWAACNLLAGGNNPFLYPVPAIVNKTNAQMDRYLQDCLHTPNNTSRFHIANRIKRALYDVVAAGIL